jgi:hypothetical protein
MNLIRTWIFLASPRAEKASISGSQETQEVLFFCPDEQIASDLCKAKAFAALS